MSVYYKATRPDGRDFYTGTVDYAAALASGEPLPELRGGAAFPGGGWYHLATVPTECVGMSWPCRLFEVEPVGDMMMDNAHPHKIGCRSVRVLREIEAHRVFGPQGEQVAALIECCRTLSAAELDRLYTAWVAAQDAAQSDRARQREKRARDRERAMGNVESQNVTAPSQNVTKSHEVSRGGHDVTPDVTPCCAVPSRAVPSLIPPTPQGVEVDGAEPLRLELEAARVAMMMVGRVISVSTSPPTIGEDCGRPAKLMNTARPRIPKTIEGTAARFELFTSIRSVKRWQPWAGTPL